MGCHPSRKPIRRHSFERVGNSAGPKVPPAVFRLVIFECIACLFVCDILNVIVAPLIRYAICLYYIKAMEAFEVDNPHHCRLAPVVIVSAEVFTDAAGCPGAT